MLKVYIEDAVLESFAKFYVTARNAIDASWSGMHFGQWREFATPSSAFAFKLCLPQGSSHMKSQKHAQVNPIYIVQ